MVIFDHGKTAEAVSTQDGSTEAIKATKAAERSIDSKAGVFSILEVKATTWVLILQIGSQTHPIGVRKLSPKA